MALRVRASRAFVGCQGPHAGPPMAGRPFVSPGQRGHGWHPGTRALSAPRHPLCRFPGLGMETREIPNGSIVDSHSGPDQDRVLGATSLWLPREPARDAYRVHPGSQPGRDPRREMAASVKGTPIIQRTVSEFGVRPTLTSVGMSASALLAAATAAWHTTVV